VIKSCIDNGIKVNSPITEFGSSGIHVATKYRKQKSINILLKYGANLDQKDKYEG